MHMAMVVYQYYMAEIHYLFKNLKRPSNFKLEEHNKAFKSIKDVNAFTN